MKMRCTLKERERAVVIRDDSEVLQNRGIITR